MTNPAPLAYGTLFRPAPTAIRHSLTLVNALSQGGSAPYAYGSRFDNNRIFAVIAADHSLTFRRCVDSAVEHSLTFLAIVDSAVEHSLTFLAMC